MVLSNVGYTTKEIKVKTATISEIALSIVQFISNSNRKDIEIRIVDCFSARVDVFKSIKDFITTDWCADWRVSLYNFSIISTDNKEYLKIIISDNIEN